MAQLKSSNLSEQYSHKNDNTVIPQQNHKQETIEAEIIAQTSAEKSNDTDTSNSSETTESVVSLIHQPLSSQTNDELILESLTLSDDFLGQSVNSVPSWLEYLSTPWTISSLALLIVANLLLTGVQLYNSRNLTEDLNSLENLPPEISSNNLSIAEGLNLAQLSSESVPLNALSTLTSQTSQTSVSSTPQKNAVSPKQLNVPQTSSNLTQALLPPSLQPQTISSHRVTPNLVTVAVPEKAINKPLAPVRVPRAVVPVNIQQQSVPSTLSNNQSIAEDKSPNLSQSNNNQAPKPKIEIYRNLIIIKPLNQKLKSILL